MRMMNCDGWWEQLGFGRQFMQELTLGMADGRVCGGGKDILNPFTLSGTIDNRGLVEIVKSYEDRHSVLYRGSFDGEGTLFGTWYVQGLSGKWSIRLLRPKWANDEEIQEILPLN